MVNSNASSYFRSTNGDRALSDWPDIAVQR
jgi:hypothetical protein